MSSPVTSRKRSRDSDTSSPLSRLLEQLKRLRVPVIDPAQANALLGPLVLECLKVNNDTAFGCILQSYGWQHEAFVLPVNLFGLSTALSKYRWVRVQELGSGSYAVVYKAKNRETDEIIALKKLRFGFDDQGLPSSTLREISLLKMLKHENIVELKDVIFGFGSNSVYVVLECLDCDLRDLLDRDDTAVDMRQIKTYMHQILSAVHHAHMHCVMHRDLKPQNILVDLASGRVKVADFGLARSFLPPHKAYTDKVVTLWYRAPELLLGTRTYSPAIDMWSVGCIFAELVNREPLFRAESEIGLLHRVFEALGTPGEAVWAGVGQLANYRSNFPQWLPKSWATLVPRLAGDRLGLDLLAAMLSYDPARRITAGQALAHPWFDELRAHAAPGGGTALGQPMGAPLQPAPGRQQVQQQARVAAAVHQMAGAQLHGNAAQWDQQQQGPDVMPLRQVQPSVLHQPRHQQQPHLQQQQQQHAAPQWVPQQLPHHAQYSHMDQQQKLQRLAAGAAAGPSGSAALGSSSAAAASKAAAAAMSAWVPQPMPGHAVAPPASSMVPAHLQQQQQPLQQPVQHVQPHAVMHQQSQQLPQHQAQQPFVAAQQQLQPVPPAMTRGKPPLPPNGRHSSVVMPPGANGGGPSGYGGGAGAHLP